jgi:hypothetical protein
MKPHHSILVLVLLALSSCSKLPSALPSPLSNQQYTEEDVRKFVTPGTPRAEIIERFGEPVYAQKNPKIEGDGTDIEEIIYFFLPPAPSGTKEHFVFAGFQVRLKNGKTVEWMASHRSSY